MTQKISSSKAENRKAIVNEITELIRRQEQKIKYQEEEIENLRTRVEDNRLAEENGIRLIKNTYSNIYIEHKKVERCLTFSKTIGNERSIEDNEEHLFAKRHTLIHLKSNTICTWIPKVGCTNLRYSIPLANGAISTPEDISWIHNNNDSFQASNKELLNANYTFVVLRNPYKRLVSFYLDKLCHNDPNKSDQSYSHAQSKFNTCGSTSFQDFIEILWDKPELINADIHVKRQIDFLIYNQYDDYFCLEDYEEALSKIQNTAGIKVIDTRGMGSGNTTEKHQESAEINYTSKASEIGELLKIGKKPKIENMYSDELCRKATVLFLPDIMLYLEKIQNSKREMHYWINQAIKN